MNLLALYKSLLSALGIEANSQGMLSIIEADGPSPVMVEERRLVLPTEKLLLNGLGDDMLGFHPLGENFLNQGESAVLTFLRKAITIDLTVKTIKLMGHLMAIGIDAAKHKTLSPKMLQMVSAIPNANEKTLKFTANVIKTIKPLGNEKLITVFLSKGGSLAGKKYLRVGMVRFPILDQLHDDSENVYGVKYPSKKDLKTLKALIEYIFPGCEDSTSYAYGTDDTTAPGFLALSMAYAGMAKRLNEVVTLFGKKLESESLPDFADLLTDISWVPAFKDLSVYEGQIPNLDASTTHGQQNHVAPVADANRLAGHAENAAPAGMDFTIRPPVSTIDGSFNNTMAHAGNSAAMIPAMNNEPSNGGVSFEEIKARSARAGAAIGATPGMGYPVNPNPAFTGYPDPRNVAPGYPGYDPRMDPRMMAAPGYGYPAAPPPGQPDWMTADVASTAAPVQPGYGYPQPGGYGYPMQPDAGARLTTQERLARGLPPVNNGGGMVYGGGAPMPPGIPPGHFLNQYGQIQQIPPGYTLNQQGQPVPMQPGGYDPRMAPPGIPPGYMLNQFNQIVPDPRFTPPGYDPRMGGQPPFLGGAPMGVDPRFANGGHATAVNMIPPMR